MEEKKSLNLDFSHRSSSAKNILSKKKNQTQKLLANLKK
jgi:hypothetical protein